MDGRRGARWTVVAIAAALLLTAATVSRLQSPSEVPTSYATGTDGMAALALLLRDEGVVVRRRTGPELPPQGILVGAAGPFAVTAEDARALRRWVSAGHEAVLLGVAPAVADAFGVSAVPVPFGTAVARAAVALPELRGAGTLRLPHPVALLPAGPGSAPATPLYGLVGLPAALALRVGAGRVYWIGSSWAWSNGTLDVAPGNLRLADNLLRGAPVVWFDEYWFGLGRAAAPAGPQAAARPLPLPRAWPAAAAAWAVAAAAGLWSAGWRRHPVRTRPRAGPRADEPIRAYAELLRRVGATAHVARILDGPPQTGRRAP